MFFMKAVSKLVSSHRKLVGPCLPDIWRQTVPENCSTVLRLRAIVSVIFWDIVLLSFVATPCKSASATLLSSCALFIVVPCLEAFYCHTTLFLCAIHCGSVSWSLLLPHYTLPVRYSLWFCLEAFYCHTTLFLCAIHCGSVLKPFTATLHSSCALFIVVLSWSLLLPHYTLPVHYSLWFRVLKPFTATLHSSCALFIVVLSWSLLLPHYTLPVRYFIVVLSWSLLLPHYTLPVHYSLWFRVLKPFTATLHSSCALFIVVLSWSLLLPHYTLPVRYSLWFCLEAFYCHTTLFLCAIHCGSVLKPFTATLHSSCALFHCGSEAS